MSNFNPGNADQPLPATCHVCNKSFGRPEHLKRHVLTHTRTREYRCRLCPKMFFRKDALSRHEATHQKVGPNLLQRGGRACLACATSKTRCTGDLPCARCHHKSLQCEYPETNNRQTDNGQGFDADGHNDQLQYLEQGDTNSAGSWNRIEGFTEANGVAPTMMSGHVANGLPDQRMDAITSERCVSTGNPVPSFEPGTRQPTIPASVLNSNTQDTALPAPTYEDDTRMNYDSTLPGFFSTINWLGVDEGNDPNAALVREWQYPTQFYDFYLPASDTHSISQASQSPGTHLQSNDLVAKVRMRSGRTPSIPWDGELTNTTGNEASADTPGEFYVDGGTARLPRMKKRRVVSEYAFHDHNARTKSFTFQLPEALVNLPPERGWFDGNAYDDMASSYSGACLSPQPLFPLFEAVELPPKSVFDRLCGLFVENCSSTLPFLHIPTYTHRPQHWLLTLSMAAIGSHYVKGSDTNRFVISMHEFIRRLLFIMTENYMQPLPDKLTQFQITLLHAVGTVYCGDGHLRTHGLGLLLKLSDFFSSSYVGHVNATPTLSPAGANDAWRSWISGEAIRRTKYSAWLIDCLWAFQFQQRPILSLNDATFMLPSGEKVWNASSAEDWTRIMKDQPPPPDLLTTLDTLYLSKKLSTQTGEFARVLLIYGLFRRSWEVEAYFSQSLSHWEPSRQQISAEIDLPTRPIWLPSIPAFMKWQNSTCDCLDVLHWQANASIGEASGFEPPVVLHLHLARVVLLAPINNIVNLARYLSGEDRSRTEQEVSADKQAIQRWAIQGQYKARLAAIHAGVVFWHVRRFSANGFYEPSAVALAALALWAFSVFSPKTATPASLAKENRPRSSPRQVDVDEANHSSDSSEDSSCTIILLDRPVDDELVQEFVLNGRSMRANMTGVGDLYGEKGPERVVREGSKILKSLNCWRVWEYWAKMLDRLVGVCKRERKRSRDAGTGNAGSNASRI